MLLIISLPPDVMHLMRCKTFACVETIYPKHKAYDRKSHRSRRLGAHPRNFVWPFDKTRFSELHAHVQSPRLLHLSTSRSAGDTGREVVKIKPSTKDEGSSPNDRLDTSMLLLGGHTRRRDGHQLGAYITGSLDQSIHANEVEIVMI
nr:hypothetical protein Iba_chr01fCG1380 [Ipomoea batatas]